MQTRQLGKTDLFITPLGFGSWAVGGGGWQFGWGSQDDRDWRLIWGSTGLIPQPYTAWAILKRLWPKLLEAALNVLTFLRSVPWSGIKKAGLVTV